MSKRASRTRHALVGYAFLSPALIGVLIFMVVPIGVIMWVSLYRWDLIGIRVTWAWPTSRTC